MIKRILSTAIVSVMAVFAMAQTNIRYVCNNSSAVSYVDNDGNAITGYHVPGRYENDGTSWAKAKNNIQDAINDLVNNNLSGEVWVAQGTYYPTETTETSGGSTLYMSFKIPKGITVRGGFRGMIVTDKMVDSENTADDGTKTKITYSYDSTNKKFVKTTVTTPTGGSATTTTADVTSNYVGESKTSERYKITNSTSSVGYYYPYQMVLDGRVTSTTKAPKFTWNATKHQYDTEFYGNAYHVVTFALNGFDSNGRANPLGTTAEIVAANGELAKLEGAMIKNGYAYNASTDGHPHNAYGGGVYMVPGASLEDVAVENCEASRDGGGVYMDGGGRCCHVYVADCQALGSSLNSGYGGGICVDENLQIFPPMVLRSAMINCVARYGGGIANKVNHTSVKITAGSKTYDMRYNQGFSALVVSGCTALTDGGGVYALNGGSFTQCTIARNACYGSGITINGMKTGQSAGFYARNNVVLANSILWGGSINDDYTKAAQYASSRSTTTDKAEIYYVAMNNAGRADFTGVKATNTIKLSRYNTATAESAAGATSNSEEGYVNFLNPLATAGHTEGAAANHFKAYESGSDTNNGISYKVQYTSACTNAGVPTGDLDTEKKTPDQKGKTADVFGDLFSSNPTLGAYTSYEISMSPDVEYTTETTTYETSGNTYKVAYAHVFVDPNTQSEYTENVGSAWDKPVKKLADALNKIGEVASTRLTAFEAGGYTITKIIVHVKEGTTTVQGADATGSIRASSLVIPDVTVTRADGSKFTIPLEILGGYKKDIEDNIYNASTNPTGKGQTSADFPARHGYADASVRNPVLYHSVVTGYVMDGYAYTTPHLFKIENIKAAVTIDGLQVRYANAWSTTLDNTVTTGGAFTITNSSNVTLKNVLIAHCQASNGPAIYETGNSTVSLENCIIHNNTINVAGITGGNFEKGGIIYIESGSTITLDHCDVLRNVGYPFYADGDITMDNSIVYANMTKALDNTNWNGQYAMDATFKGSGTVNCTYKDASNHGYNLFDIGSASDTKAAAIAVGGVCDQDFDYQTNVENNYPAFVNPTNNSGVTEQGDKTFYGRATSFEPMNTNPCLNAASTSKVVDGVVTAVAHASAGSDDSWGKDMSDNVNRDYGGLPDIGAVESHPSTKAEVDELANADGQREYGSVYYVRDYRFSNGNISYNEGGDGSSWNKAINGNAIYGSDGTIQTVTYTETTQAAGWKETSLSSYSNEAGSTILESENYVQKEGTVVLKNSSNKYLKLNGTSLTTGTLEEASLFKFSASGTSYTIQVYDESSSTYKDVGFNYTESTSKGQTTRTYSLQIGSPTYKTWTVENNRIYTTHTSGSGKNARTTYYYLSESGITSATSSSYVTQWTPYNRYYQSESETIYTPTDLSTVRTKGLNGLQYAVNKANTAFETKKSATWSTIDPSKIEVGDIVSDNSDGSSSSIVQTYNVDTWQAKTTVYTITPIEVWVGAGTYAKDNESGDQSCFMIKEGVGVYGAFPKVGNPCKDQREPLVSKYVKIVTDYKPDDYETILEPITQDKYTSGITRRVLGEPYETTEHDYIYAKWDGFTLRKGALDASKLTNSNAAGGGGACIYDNVTLKNLVVTDNTTYKATADVDKNTLGGGVYMNGGVFEEGYIINNTVCYMNNGTASTSSGICYGGGLYLYNGTVYNSVIANNNSTGAYADGGGVFFENATFFNNTIVNNYANGSSRASGGVNIYRDEGKAEDESSSVHLINCIVLNNTGSTGGQAGNKDVAIANKGAIYLDHCIAESTTGNESTTAYISYTNSTAVTDVTSLFDTDGGIGSYGTDLSTINLRLKYGSSAINAGDDSPTINSNTYDLSVYTDMDYQDRIQDCTIDIGAYEYNDSYSITPDETTESGKAIYYVTPNGYGSASAADPANAACAAKLQKVIDAAGRYKWYLLNDDDTDNDNTQVIVKVANSYSMYHAASSSNFTYYATRTTNINAGSTDIDMRMWSIIVPRGVEVWGGYTDVPMTYNTTTKAVEKDTETTHTWGNTYNGFYSGTTDLRDILGNPTYFDAAYHNNVENSDVVGYHVVAFSDNVFDGSGNAYKSVDATKISTSQDASSSGDAITLGSTYGRGIVDGIFITGGKANANSTSTKSTNIYGGAAIVNEYGHVRNCIIRNNEGDYGGGLAIAKGGLVSGCLIDQNTAIKEGGGIYVLTDEENTNIGLTGGIPHVYTSTIVNNTASVQGGGLHFDDKDNVRVNSSVIWQNHCTDMADVAGTYAPEKPTDDETSADAYYPISYTAIQNLPASGTNNISISQENKAGARFWKDGDAETVIASETDFSQFGFYKLTNISALLRVGMPVATYKTLSENTSENAATYIGLAENDFAAVARDANSAGGVRTYIDMGARALDKKINDQALMLRLFVAQAEDVDADAETDFSQLTGDTGSDQEYYSQQGSSFAYPFHNLQDALDYIYTKRGAILGTTTEDIGTPSQNANYLPFEICVAKGTYYPTKDLMGNYGQSFSNTFAIPEGVSVFGGFNATELGSKKFYGRYYKAKSTMEVTYTKESTNSLEPSYITKNVEPVNSGSTKFPNDDVITGYNIIEASTDTILTNRTRADINGNSIIEPWEFKNQTYLSGATVGDEATGVFHVVTFVPDQNVVGVLPPKGLNLATAYDAAVTADGTTGVTHYYKLHEQGQYSVLNGLIITKGSAKNFNYDINMNQYSKYNYYAGGGMLADGNRYDDSYGEYLRNGGTAPTTCSVDYKHTGVSDPVAYRDQVVTITQCKFIDNVAGYGGAIASNSTTDIYNSTFEDNLAVYGVDKNVPKVTTDDDNNSTTTYIDITYPGQGGAIQATYQLAAYNTVFANNEARSTDYTIEAKQFPTYRNPDGGISMFSGIGGAVYTGFQGHFHLVNCDIVHNMANHYPAVFTRNPNVYQDTHSDQLSINDYNQLLNTVAWGNEINSTMAAKFSNNDNFKFAADLICNYGASGRDTWTAYSVNYGTTPTVPTKQSDLDDQSKFAETAWFSAYEEGRGVTCKNTKDLRDFSFRPYLHAGYQIKTAADNTSQNCNILIDSENKTLEGPNFSSPSKSAGCDGYDEGADWSPARLNNLTDNGSGKIIQEITKKSDETYECKFPTYATATKDKDGNTISGTTVEGFWGSEEKAARAPYTNETDNSYITSGAYTVARYSTPMNYTNSLPIAETYYMKSLNGTTEQQSLYRISYDPNPTHNATYIDIGVYEYPHTPLKMTTEGDEVDILWVSSVEKPDNGLPEGSAWSQPTSDLQRAIETLLSSRNGHRKEIRLMDGTYSPTYTIENNLSFYFDTNYINSSVVLPTNNGSAVEGLGVKSFTIKGGYSKDLNDQYDIDEYPAIVRQKKQTESNTHKWDHLFYVKDATQRYGSKTEYNAANGFGWYSGTESAGTKAASGTAPTIIPIQIDGVSFVNTQTDADAAGAAVYYADQTFNSECIQTAGATDYIANAPTSAYVSLMDENGDKVVDNDHSPAVIYYTDANHTSVSSTETSYKGSYYKSVTKENPYKLILSRSTVMNSSAVNRGAITSAAYIGKFGGEALVYNSVFHSNYGKSLDAYATKTINNTFALNHGMMVLNDKTGNSTYDDAVDASNNKIHDYKSTIYNSVFWKNNNGGSGTTYGSQFNLVADASTTYDGSVSAGKVSKLTTTIQSNAYTGGNEDAIEYDKNDEGSETNTIKSNNYNVGISDANSDAVYGPNFVNPNDSYTGTADSIIEARDFMLQPSLRLLNRGDNNTAHDAALTAGTALYSTGNLTAATPVFGDIYDYAWVTSTNTDAASEARIVVASNGLIDLGAYEYQSKQNRVLYVDPNTLTSGTGLSWASPLGYGNIQAAIDACAVYFKNEHKQTYVFVKANSGTNLGQHSGETLTMRNGVAVYGSVVSDYLVDCHYDTNAAGDYVYDDATLATYVKDIKVYHRNGVISPTEGHTRILGINTNGTAFDSGKTCISGSGTTPNAVPMAVMDGFDVTAQLDASSDAMTEVTAPVININPKKNDNDLATGGLKMVVHNIVVHGNDFHKGASGASNPAVDNSLININNCLLYEALVYNNSVASTGSVLNLYGFKGGNYGYAASVTVEGKTTGADDSYGLNNCSASTKTYDKDATYDGTTAANPTSGNLTSSHIYNSITNYDQDPTTWKTLSGYCYKQSYQGSNYQLTEKSKYIDCITVTKPNNDGTTNQQDVLGGTADADYKSGGMPANLSEFIHYWPTVSDETWTQADRDVLGNFRLQTLGTVAGGKYNGNDYSSDGSTAYAPKLDRGACETWDVKQSTLNLFPDFPHDGSVEYIRAGKSLIIDPIITGVVNSAHEPGFCLLEMGANLYGNGRRVEIPYVAVESYIPAGYVKSGSSFVMSAPFRMNYNTTTEITSALASFDKGVAVQGIGTVSYDDDGGLLYNRTDANFFTYDGAGRSETDYEFNTGITSNETTSGPNCWKSTTGDIAAARGVLMVYNSDVTDQITYRVTSKGVNYEDNVYTEEVNFLDNHVFQSVPLYKYDDAESTKGAADFTDMNDQGWNCIGLPYLVSNYHPYYKATATYNPGASKPVEVSIKKPGETGYDGLSDAYYAMNKPSTMWLYYNGNVDSSGNRISIDGVKVNGDGGFYSVNSWEAATSADQLTGANDVTLYNPWHVTALTSQRVYMGEGFFVQNQKFSGDEDLKFYIPVAPTLPINAIQSSKESNLTFWDRYYYDGSDIDGISTPEMNESGDTSWKVAVRKNTLNIYNLNEGDDITIYTSAGQLSLKATATGYDYSTPLAPGIYVVKVNAGTKKVVVR